MKRKWWVIIIIAFMISAIAVYFLKGKPLVVDQVLLHQKVIKKTISANGKVKSLGEADLAFTTTGKLTLKKSAKGDLVESRELLAGIYNIPLIENAKALKDARDVALRTLDLHFQQKEDKIDTLGGENEYDIETRRLQELISKAEAEYRSALGSITGAYIYAPFSGTIIDVMYELGEVVVAGTTAVKLADLDELIFEIELDQEDFGLLKIGQKAEITLDSFNDKTFTGEIIEIPYFTDGKENDAFEVKIRITDVQMDKILLGMTGDAYIILQSTDNEVQALMFDDVLFDIEDQPYVYVLENGIVKKQYLDIGLEGDLYTEILTTITNPIVKSIKDTQELKEGQRAKINR